MAKRESVRKKKKETGRMVAVGAVVVVAAAAASLLCVLKKFCVAVPVVDACVSLEETAHELVEVKPQQPS